MLGYRDEAALIAETLGIVPRETVRTTAFGGDGPQRLVGDTARSIANGEVDVAVVSGAEAVASVLALGRAGETPPWAEQAAEVAPTRVVGTDRAPTSESEMAVGLMAPIYNYALLETAVRASSGADPQSAPAPAGRAVVALLRGCLRPTRTRGWRRRARRRS